jgi:small subunit ribosomal protein S20
MGSRTAWSTGNVANIRSQKKRNRQNEKRRVRNKSVRTELKTRVKNAREAVVAGDESAPELVRVAQKRLDKAGAKGVIHKNAAARRTSRLMKRKSPA